MLKSVQKPGRTVVSFEYDALGRRTAKIAGNKITRYLWDGNVLLQEWSYDTADRPKLLVGELGELFYDKTEPVDNVII
jgi:YD repeat-containing protein